ncbi:MAG: SUMF1/EgtB/PvdO family nonheme iron enzyme [Roseibacillus sp.]|nr:SUMF1/EgtB/PvdO family nonheme iron enzyme [Roseibacillus sp.]MDP7306278.1 SUMF1/EgtB/PvdO family nonheme iron enzyme [Roseibacillus sp.]|tara:strand:- start:13925 stop:15421 length:1497 start_codon:yes stop_codon:yes gene_type:complete
MSGSEKDQVRPALRQLGDYLLMELISEDEETRTYHARQRSIDRAVILVRLKGVIDPTRPSGEAFLADVRAKAAIEHAGIGSVYEAAREEEEVYWTRELLPGGTFAQIHQEGRKFAPSTIVGFLRQVGGAMAYLAERAIATRPLVPEHLVLGEHEVVRIANLATAGQPDPDGRVRDQGMVGELFQGMLETDLPGAARTGRLLGMMMGLEEGLELSWTQIANTAGMLEQDLASEAGTSRALQARKRVRAIGIMLLAVLVVGVLGGGGLFLFTRPRAPEARDLSAMIAIPAGTYQNHAGKEVELDRFWIDAHEVTIAEYAEFLTALASLEESMRNKHDHITQPALKPDHLPDDWYAVLSAARAGRNYDGLPFDLNCPVTRIDWWDAHAYANWKGGRLPTQEEWLAAATLDREETIRAGGWGPVDQSSGDVTPRRVHGLAGNVAEWSENPERNPAFPMNARSPLACGGTFLAPGGGVRARIWLNTREVRRRDVGFRLVQAAP